MVIEREQQSDAGLRTAHIWESDGASRGLGMEIVTVEPGYVEMSMTVRADMVNVHGIAHGGFITALADSALGYAASAAGASVVTTSIAVDFLAPARLGDVPSPLAPSDGTPVAPPAAWWSLSNASQGDRISGVAYYRAHVAPWLHRRLTGRSSGDGRTGKSLSWTTVDAA